MGKTNACLRFFSENNFQAEKQKITDSLNVVNDAVNSVEKHQDEWFDKLAKSLRAEIKTREANTDSIQKQISDLDAKFAEALILIDKEVQVWQMGPQNDRLEDIT